MPPDKLPDILYVGGFYFPETEAGAIRVLGIGKALREAGLRVAFAGTEKRPRPEDREDDGRYRYQGFPYLSERDLGCTRWSRLKRAWLTHATGATTLQRLQSLPLSATRAIVAYNATAPLLWRLRSFCRRRRIALLADCTEWYHAAHHWGGTLGPLHWDVAWRMRVLHPRIGRLIVISSYLDRYYRDRGCATVRVPPLVDFSELPDASLPALGREDDRLHLVYAGVPGRKDLIGNAIRSLPQLRQGSRAVVLHLVGPSREHVRDVCLQGDGKPLDEAGDALVFHGRVSHREAVRLVATADFSVLLRPDERFAHAGFSTKLVESMSLGVPAISNVTSDIGEYVRDGREGVLLQGCTTEHFAAGVRRALDLSAAARRDMRRSARQRAEECFDYKRHAAPLRQFVGDAIAALPAEGR